MHPDKVSSAALIYTSLEGRMPTDDIARVIAEQTGECEGGARNLLRIVKNIIREVTDILERRHPRIGWGNHVAKRHLALEYDFLGAEARHEIYKFAKAAACGHHAARELESL